MFTTERREFFFLKILVQIVSVLPSGGGLSGLGGIASGTFFSGIAAFGTSGALKILVFS